MALDSSSKPRLPPRFSLQSGGNFLANSETEVFFTMVWLHFEPQVFFPVPLGHCAGVGVPAVMVSLSLLLFWAFLYLIFLSLIL